MEMLELRGLHKTFNPGSRPIKHLRPSKSVMDISGTSQRFHACISIHAVEAEHHTLRCFVLKLFIADGSAIAFFCSDRTISGITETPQFGFAFMSASSVVQSSPSSRP